MAHDRDSWESEEQGESRAVDGLSERSTRMLDRLAAKLARHTQGAEALAQALQHKRHKS